MIEQFLPSDSQEALANNRITGGTWHSWDDAATNLNEPLVGFCASYSALARYLSGADLYILPRNVVELESILRRYAHDAIHNTISHSRGKLAPGGYSRTCHIAHRSLAAVIRTGDNAAVLLAMHHTTDKMDVHNHQSDGDTPDSNLPPCIRQP